MCCLGASRASLYKRDSQCVWELGFAMERCVCCERTNCASYMAFSCLPEGVSSRSFGGDKVRAAVTDALLGVMVMQRRALMSLR
jgi:hypothetical protein